MAQARQDLDYRTEELREALLTQLKDKQTQLTRLGGFLARSTPYRLITPYREKLQGFKAQLEAFHPLGPLKRGYAIVTHKKTGAILRSPKGLKKGDRLGIQLEKGILESEVL